MLVWSGLQSALYAPPTHIRTLRIPKRMERTVGADIPASGFLQVTCCQLRIVRALSKLCWRRLDKKHPPPEPFAKQRVYLILTHTQNCVTQAHSRMISKSRRLPVTDSDSKERDGAAIMIWPASMPCPTNIAIIAVARKRPVAGFSPARKSLVC